MPPNCRVSVNGVPTDPPPSGASPLPQLTRVRLTMLTQEQRRKREGKEDLQQLGLVDPCNTAHGQQAEGLLLSADLSVQFQKKRVTLILASRPLV